MVLDPQGSGYDLTPYCGAPADPIATLSRWNFDPVLLAGLLAVACAWAVAYEPSLAAAPAASRSRRLAFIVGWLITSLALVSPLCAASVSLFSARVAQHMLLTTVAAPLVALGLPRRRGHGPRREWLAAGSFAAALWFWHAPGPYDATFENDFVYWLMHLTLYGAAVWFWREVLAGPPERLARGLGASLAVSLAMAFLGAVLTFSERAFYAPHILTTAAWGLSPLRDQQLGGVIMWVPAGVVFVAAILASLTTVMRAPEAALASRAS